MKATKQVINMACANAGISQSELARRIGWAPAAFSNRIKTEKFSREEWEAIAKAVNAEVQLTLTFKDGTVIG